MVHRHDTLFENVDVTGEPAYVLLNIKDYRSLAGTNQSVIDLLAAEPSTEDINLEIPESRDLGRAADLS